MTEWKKEVSRVLVELRIDPAHEASVIDELAQHLDDRYRELVSKGLSARRARKVTLAEMRDCEMLKRELSQTRPRPGDDPGLLGTPRTKMLSDLLQDLRYGLRMFRKNPGLSVIATLTLVLGIGANTAIFSAIQALLLCPLPVEEPERLVVGYALREGFDPFGTSLLEFAAYRERTSVFEESGVAGPRSFNLTGSGEPERLRGAAVMATYFAALGSRPIVGHTFTAEEDQPGGPAVALIGYDLWQRRFGGESSVVGRALNLDGRAYTITGVMAPGFDLPYSAEVWVPYQVNISALPLEQQAATANELIARLSSGVSLEQADAELKTVAQQLAEEYPQIRRGWSYRLTSLREHLIGDSDGRVRNALVALMAAVGFLLLICCANVASLLLARGVTREREIAIRQALGAARWRIVRQLLTEGMWLAMLGGAGGLLLAHWLTRVLSALNPIQAVSFGQSLTDIKIDSSVLQFTLIVSVLTGLVFGAVPALKLTGLRDSINVLKRESPASRGSKQRWLGTLVVVEMAVAVTLLISGGLMTQSFARLQRVELGFQPAGLLTMQMALSPNKYTEHSQRVAFVERLLERVKSLPGVTSAGITTNIPLQRVSFDSVYTVEGRPSANPADVPITAHRIVSSEYLQTIGVTLVAGRLLSEHDRADSLPVVVVSEELARQAWPGEDVIGKQIRRGRPHQTNFPWMTVVGIVRDVKEDRFNFRIDRAAWYTPISQQQAAVPLNLVVKTTVDPASLTAAVRESIRSLDADQPITDVTTLTDHVAGVSRTERFSAVLMASLAALGLILSALGLYGVMSYSVSQGTRELGLRLALGARPSEIFKLVMKRGAVLSLIGLGIGTVGALVSTRFLAGVLYGVSATDPLTFASIGLVLAVVGLAACYLPARRATRVDPLVAIRCE
jgi:predicted permease